MRNTVLPIPISSCTKILWSHDAGGFLSFKPNIPKQLLLDGAHTVESHFQLVNYQVSSAISLFHLFSGCTSFIESRMYIA
jgi:hypothetical protein